MTIVYQVQNFALLGSRDKPGNYILKLIDGLVASGLYRVRGSGVGDGSGGAFQLMGQTAGLGGLQPYNVLTAGLATNTVLTQWNNGAANSFSNTRAWCTLEEIASGRCLTIKRTNNAGLATAFALSVSWALGGVASSGATASQPPANVGTTYFYQGTAHTDGAQATVSIASSPLDSNPWWVNVAVDPVVQASNTCPYLAFLVDRTNGNFLHGSYEALVKRCSTTETVPAVFAWGAWNNVFGQLGAVSNGPFYEAAPTQVRVGSTLAACSFERGSAGAYASGALIPGSSFAAVRGDNTVVTSIIETWNSAGQVGVIDDWFVNPHNRNFPTTYGIGTVTPRVTLGQVIVPWTMGVAPAWSP